MTTDESATCALLNPRLGLQHEVDAALVVVLGMLGSQARDQRLHVLVRLRHSHAGLEARDDAERVVATTGVLIPVAGDDVIELRERDPERGNDER